MHGTHDPWARIVLISVLFAIYLGAGIFHSWIATAFYREYYYIGTNVTLGLAVPIYPVWVVGVFPLAYFLFYEQYAKCDLREMIRALLLNCDNASIGLA